MNGKEFIKAVKNITAEKGISEDIVFDAMEQALITAYKKNFDSKTNVKVVINRETGKKEKAVFREAKITRNTGEVTISQKLIDYVYKLVEKEKGLSYKFISSNVVLSPSFLTQYTSVKETHRYDSDIFALSLSVTACMTPILFRISFAYFRSRDNTLDAHQ